MWCVPAPLSVLLTEAGVVPDQPVPLVTAVGRLAAEHEVCGVHTAVLWGQRGGTHEGHAPGQGAVPPAVQVALYDRLSLEGVARLALVEGEAAEGEGGVLDVGVWDGGGEGTDDGGACGRLLVAPRPGRGALRLRAARRHVAAVTLVGRRAAVRRLRDDDGGVRDDGRVPAGDHVAARAVALPLQGGATHQQVVTVQVEAGLAAVEHGASEDGAVHPAEGVGQGGRGATAARHAHRSNAAPLAGGAALHVRRRPLLDEAGIALERRHVRELVSGRDEAAVCQRWRGAARHAVALRYVCRPLGGTVAGDGLFAAQPVALVTEERDECADRVLVSHHPAVARLARPDTLLEAAVRLGAGPGAVGLAVALAAAQQLVAPVTLVDDARAEGVLRARLGEAVLEAGRLWTQHLGAARRLAAPHPRAGRRAPTLTPPHHPGRQLVAGVTAVLEDGSVRPRRWRHRAVLDGGRPAASDRPADGRAAAPRVVGETDAARLALQRVAGLTVVSDALSQPALGVARDVAVRHAACLQTLAGHAAHLLPGPLAGGGADERPRPRQLVPGLARVLHPCPVPHVCWLHLVGVFHCGRGATGDPLAPRPRIFPLPAAETREFHRRVRWRHLVAGVAADDDDVADKAPGAVDAGVRDAGRRDAGDAVAGRGLSTPAAVSLTHVVRLSHQPVPRRTRVPDLVAVAEAHRHVLAVGDVGGQPAADAAALRRLAPSAVRPAPGDRCPAQLVPLITAVHRLVREEDGGGRGGARLHRFRPPTRHPPARRHVARPVAVRLTEQLALAAQLEAGVALQLHAVSERVPLSGPHHAAVLHPRIRAVDDGAVRPSGRPLLLTAALHMGRAVHLEANGAGQLQLAAVLVRLGVGGLRRERHLNVHVGRQGRQLAGEQVTGRQDIGPRLVRQTEHIGLSLQLVPLVALKVDGVPESERRVVLRTADELAVRDPGTGAERLFAGGRLARPRPVTAALQLRVSKQLVPQVTLDLHGRPVHVVAGHRRLDDHQTRTLDASTCRDDRRPALVASAHTPAGSGEREAHLAREADVGAVGVGLVEHLDAVDAHEAVLEGADGAEDGVAGGDGGGPAAVGKALEAGGRLPHLVPRLAVHLQRVAPFVRRPDALHRHAVLDEGLLTRHPVARRRRRRPVTRRETRLLGTPLVRQLVAAVTLEAEAAAVGVAWWGVGAEHAAVVERSGRAGDKAAGGDSSRPRAVRLADGLRAAVQLVAGVAVEQGAVGEVEAHCVRRLVRRRVAVSQRRGLALNARALGQGCVPRGLHTPPRWPGRLVAGLAGHLQLLAGLVVLRSSEHQVGVGGGGGACTRHLLTAGRRRWPLLRGCAPQLRLAHQPVAAVTLEAEAAAVGVAWWGVGAEHAAVVERSGRAGDKAAGGDSSRPSAVRLADGLRAAVQLVAGVAVEQGAVEEVEARCVRRLVRRRVAVSQRRGLALNARALGQGCVPRGLHTPPRWPGRLVAGLAGHLQLLAGLVVLRSSEHQVGVGGGGGACTRHLLTVGRRRWPLLRGCAPQLRLAHQPVAAVTLEAEAAAVGVAWWGVGAEHAAVVERSGRAGDKAAGGDSSRPSAVRLADGLRAAVQLVAGVAVEQGAVGEVEARCVRRLVRRRVAVSQRRGLALNARALGQGCVPRGLHTLPRWPGRLVAGLAGHLQLLAGLVVLRSSEHQVGVGGGGGACTRHLLTAGRRRWPLLRGCAPQLRLAHQPVAAVTLEAEAAAVGVAWWGVGAEHAAVVERSGRAGDKAAGGDSSRPSAVRLADGLRAAVQLVAGVAVEQGAVGEVEARCVRRRVRRRVAVSQRRGLALNAPALGQGCVPRGLHTPPRWPGRLVAGLAGHLQLLAGLVVLRSSEHQVGVGGGGGACTRHLLTAGRRRWPLPRGCAPQLRLAHQPVAGGTTEANGRVKGEAGGVVRGVDDDDAAVVDSGSRAVHGQAGGQLPHPLRLLPAPHGGATCQLEADVAARRHQVSVVDGRVGGDGGVRDGGRDAAHPVARRQRRRPRAVVETRQVGGAVQPEAFHALQPHSESWEERAEVRGPALHAVLPGRPGDAGRRHVEWGTGEQCADRRLARPPLVRPTRPRCVHPAQHVALEARVLDGVAVVVAGGRMHVSVHEDGRRAAAFEHAGGQRAGPGAERGAAPLAAAVQCVPRVARVAHHVAEVVTAHRDLAVRQAARVHALGLAAERRGARVVAAGGAVHAVDVPQDVAVLAPVLHHLEGRNAHLVRLSVGDGRRHAAVDLCTLRLHSGPRLVGQTVALPIALQPPAGLARVGGAPAHVERGAVEVAALDVGQGGTLLADALRLHSAPRRVRRASPLRAPRQPEARLALIPHRRAEAEVGSSHGAVEGALGLGAVDAGTARDAVVPLAARLTPAPAWRPGQLVARLTLVLDDGRVREIGADQTAIVDDGGRLDARDGPTARHAARPRLVSLARPRHGIQRLVAGVAVVHGGEAHVQAGRVVVAVRDGGGQGACDAHARRLRAAPARVQHAAAHVVAARQLVGGAALEADHRAVRQRRHVVEAVCGGGEGRAGDEGAGGGWAGPRPVQLAHGGRYPAQLVPDLTPVEGGLPG